MQCEHQDSENTTRETTREVGDGRKSSIFKREDATRYRSMCLRLSYLTQDGFDLAETAKHLAQQKREPRAFDFIPMKRAARYLVGKHRSSLSYRRQERVDKISLRGERFRCRIQSREKARRDWWLKLAFTL